MTLIMDLQVYMEKKNLQKDRQIHYNPLLHKSWSLSVLVNQKS